MDREMAQVAQLRALEMENTALRTKVVALTGVVADFLAATQPFADWLKVHDKSVDLPIFTHLGEVHNCHRAALS